MQNFDITTYTWGTNIVVKATDPTTGLSFQSSGERSHWKNREAAVAGLQKLIEEKVIANDNF